MRYSRILEEKKKKDFRINIASTIYSSHKTLI